MVATTKGKKARGVSTSLLQWKVRFSSSEARDVPKSAPLVFSMYVEIGKEAYGSHAAGYDSTWDGIDSVSLEVSVELHKGKISQIL